MKERSAPTLSRRKISRLLGLRTDEDRHVRATSTATSYVSGDADGDAGDAGDGCRRSGGSTTFFRLRPNAIRRLEVGTTMIENEGGRRVVTTIE